MRKLGLVVALLLAGIGVYVHAATITNTQYNPTSNVLCDGAATAGTCVGRTTDGSFALVAVTSTTLANNTAPLGQLYVVVDSSNRFWAICVSTGGTTAGNSVFLSTAAFGVGSSVISGNSVKPCAQN